MLWCGLRGAGGVAQLGERLNGIQEVRGSIPLASTGPAAVRVWFVSGAESGRRAGIAQLVEHNLAKVGVAGSSPVSRSSFRFVWIDRGLIDRKLSQSGG